jgi:hypothetical protein
MSKIIYYLIAALVVIVGTAGGYYYFTKIDVLNVEAPAATVPHAPPDPPVKPKPDHGDFQKRFQPVMPPANGGKLN